MPIPYRKVPRADEDGVAAFLDVVWLKAARTFHGGLLLLDSRGRPLEFVYNTLTAPTGFLWPESQVRRLGTARLAHTLFEACRREPHLLVCRSELGDVEFCRSELAPSIPFASVAAPSGDNPMHWCWVNDPPTPAMKAHGLAQALQQRGLATEPFARVLDGLREVYPDAPWPSS